MNSNEAGRLQEAWKTKHGDKSCQHGRVVESFTTQDGQYTGKFACKECGAIYPDPPTAPTDSSSLKK